MGGGKHKISVNIKWIKKMWHIYIQWSIINYKEEIPAVCDNMEELDRHHVKWNKLNKERQILFSFVYRIYKVELLEVGTRMVITRAKGWGNEKMLDKGYKLFFFFFFFLIWISSEDLVYYRMTIVNNNVLYTWHLF